MTPNLLPRILLTTGEPAGIGPDLALQLALREIAARLVVVADPDMLATRAAQLNLSIRLQVLAKVDEAQAHILGCLQVLPVKVVAPVTAGQLDVRNAQHVLNQLGIASDLALQDKVDAIVTAPVQKSIINDAGMSFTGHTEFFAERAKSNVVMMLTSKDLRVALATTHLPLRAVADAITVESLQTTLNILHHDLRIKFGMPSPRILVLGLNPHAGEAGHLGREEIDVIEPCLNHLRAQGMDLLGPVPADTAFTPNHLQNADAVLAMYHDQGLPVLKHAGFGQAVNITLGLPYIRTSVDHGTALALAGTGRAELGSLRAALDLAIDLSLRRADLVHHATHGHHTQTHAQDHS